jgi:hypothetical protein
MRRSVKQAGVRLVVYVCMQGGSVERGRGVWFKYSTAGQEQGVHRVRTAIGAWIIIRFFMSCPPVLLLQVRA